MFYILFQGFVKARCVDPPAAFGKSTESSIEEEGEGDDEEVKEEEEEEDAYSKEFKKFNNDPVVKITLEAPPGS